MEIEEKTLNERTRDDYMYGWVSREVWCGMCDEMEWKGYCQENRWREMCNSFGAEALPMGEAMRAIESERPTSVRICTASQSLLSTHEIDMVSMNVVVEDIEELLVKVIEKCEVMLEWVPSHVGVKGNEWADVEAGRAREEDQMSIGINFESVKRYIRKRVK